MLFCKVVIIITYYKDNSLYYVYLKTGFSTFLLLLLEVLNRSIGGKYFWVVPGLVNWNGGFIKCVKNKIFICSLCCLLYVTKWTYHCKIMCTSWVSVYAIYEWRIQDLILMGASNEFASLWNSKRSMVLIRIFRSRALSPSPSPSVTALF